MIAARTRLFASRAALVLVALMAGLVAWRAGGGAEGAAAPPRLSEGDAGRAGGSAVAVAGTAAGSAEGYEVAARLVEMVQSARIDAPADPAADAIFASHWRKMRSPWLPPGGAASRHVTSIALRTSATETQWAMPAGAGRQWAPDARVWNMNEGSFDQRDALVAPAPSAFTFRVSVPAGARLTFAEGTVNAMRDAVVFVVTVVDAKGTAHEVHRHRLPPAAARRWTDASADLGAFAGQSVEVRLATEVAPATEEEARAAAKAKAAARAAERRAAADAGAGGAAAARGATGTTGTTATAATGGDAGAPKPDLLGLPGVPVTLWGNPTLLAKTTPRVPYNVLFIVVDALRPDVIASFHDDADDDAKARAPSPPLEAWLPKVPGVTPAIDALAKKGVRFTRAYSAGAWTRPGTLAMLSGARSSELGLDTLSWVLRPPAPARFYASDPPLLPLALRRRGVTTHAFVNNYFMVGYAPVGIDMGFEHVADHRYRTRDTLEITEDASRFIRESKDTRFFLFVNYNSPHEPYDPPEHLLARIPPPPAGPADEIARLYMAEAAKDDEAIGRLVDALAEAGLRERTIIVITADHGETLSSAHQGVSALDKMPVRYHHAVSNYEETSRVPILIVAPGLLPEDRAVAARVRNVDIAPTLVELLGMEPHPRASGASLVALAKGQKEAEERVVVTEGRGTRGIIHGRHRLLVREGLARTTTVGERTVTVSEELFDLVDDPGERVDLAPSKPELVAEMRARLDAALKNARVAGSAPAASGAGSGNELPRIALRFVSAASPRRVAGKLVIGDATTKARSFTVEPVELGHDAFKTDGTRVEVAFTTIASAPVGFDVVVDPPGAPVTWELYSDDRPWPEAAVFGGPFGLAAPRLAKGIATDDARRLADARLLPPIDPRRDSGLFVIRDRRAEPAGAGEGAAAGDEGAEEMARLLREWGYAHGSGATGSGATR